jgi:group II intron reverse transcriptase/maturase
MRPIGIPTFEDKIAQRAIAMLLEAIYEQDFEDCSFGFRPGRSAHQALQALWERLMAMRGGWIIEIDIEAFFDTLDHGVLRSFLDKQVRDGVLRRAIDKWLRAGVLTDSGIQRPERGTPQGGVISPLLANIYLHEVLDRWFQDTVRPRLRGNGMLIRYADDAVLVFDREDDAHRVMTVLGKRFARYGLKLHPDKTRLIAFRAPSRRSDGQRGAFELLGFTHYWGRSRRGTWIVCRKTAPKRFGRSLGRVRAWCRRHRHIPVEQQHAALGRMLHGHYAYYGVTGNFRALQRFLHEVQRSWRLWLDRRSQSGRMTWERFRRLLHRRPLPRPRAVQSVYRHAAKP